MAASRFGKVIGKEISEIKINSVPKNLCKNTKTIIRLRLGDYYTIDAVFFVIHKPLYPINTSPSESQGRDLIFSREERVYCPGQYTIYNLRKPRQLCNKTVKYLELGLYAIYTALGRCAPSELYIAYIPRYRYLTLTYSPRHRLGEYSPIITSPSAKIVKR
jgi:hypothetical protein